jgi:hypothetical protein
LVGKINRDKLAAIVHARVATQDYPQNLNPASVNDYSEGFPLLSVTIFG